MLLLNCLSVVEGLHKKGHRIQLRLTMSEVRTPERVVYVRMLECIRPKEIVFRLHSDGKIHKAFGPVEEVFGYDHHVCVCVLQTSRHFP